MDRIEISTNTNLSLRRQKSSNTKAIDSAQQFYERFCRYFYVIQKSTYYATTSHHIPQHPTTSHNISPHPTTSLVISKLYALIKETVLESVLSSDDFLSVYRMPNSSLR